MIEYYYNENISNEEYDVLCRFLNNYEDKDVIVADNYRIDFTIVPFKNEKVSFKPNQKPFKSITFRQRIIYKGKTYIVRLGLWRTHSEKPKCLTISEFNILTARKQHQLTLSTSDYFQSEILYNIIDIFKENKIISPESAYSERMYTNTQLQDFMHNHEWEKINEGINQKPVLADALFIMENSSNNNGDFNADFGTILYQLIDYRKKHINEFTKSDLLELDKVILTLSKNELLKVHLRDDIGFAMTIPSGSILLDGRYNGSQMRISEQYNVDNGKLIKEERYLNRILKQFKNK